jgi:hypothetical protein
MDCLNMRRNITETPTGKGIMRYLKDPKRADDFMHSTNYAAMMRRIILKEPTIPNQQLVRELAGTFGTGPAYVRGADATMAMVGEYISG